MHIARLSCILFCLNMHTYVAGYCPNYWILILLLYVHLKENAEVAVREMLKEIAIKVKVRNIY